MENLMEAEVKNKQAQTKGGTMRTGAQYLSSLNDGRHVVINGEKVKDVTKHPAFAGICQTVAKLYDYAASNKEEMTFTSPKTGKPVALRHLIPQSIDDLKKRRIALMRTAEQTYGLLGRSPDHVASFIAGFASAPEVFDKNGAKFGAGANVTRFHEKIRDEHLYVTYTIIQPQVDRSKAAHELEDKHIPVGYLKEDEKGITIRGAQMLGTATIVSDYLFLSNINPLKPGDEDYAISVVLPVNSKGLKLYPRRSYAENQPSVFDYPLSTRFDESDALAVFDDVFIPWENVFICRDIALARAQWFEAPAHIMGNSQAQIRLAVKTRFLAGIARKIAATNGIDKIPSVTWDLGELASLAASVEGMTLASETSAIKNAKGVVYPNPKFMYGAMGAQAQLYPRMIQIVRELCGGGVLQVPSSVHEFKNPESAKDIQKFVQSPGVKSEERVKLFKLAWDMIGSEFAGRHQQYEIFYAGAPFVAKMYSFNNYNYKDAVDLVDQCLKGYDMDTPLPGEK